MADKYATENAQRLLTTVVGLKYDDAFNQALDLGVRMRISIDNGEPRILTRDYDPARLTVEVTGDSISKAKIG